MVHHSPIEDNLLSSMREELEFFEDFLAPNSGVEWEYPITYLIKRTPFAATSRDACLDSARVYSIGLKCVWWLTFPDAVVECSLKFLNDNRDSNLVSINVLEFPTVITGYCAAYRAVTSMDVTGDPPTPLPPLPCFFKND